MTTLSMSAKTNQSLPSSEPGYFGCILGLGFACVTLLYAFHMVFTGSDDMMVYKVAITSIGIIEAVVCLYTLGGSRAAWSYALALNGSLGLMLIIGAPQVRNGMDKLKWVHDTLGEVPLALGFVPAFFVVSITVLLAYSAKHY